MSQFLPTGKFQWINPEAWDAEKIQALGNEDSTGNLTARKINHFFSF